MATACDTIDQTQVTWDTLDMFKLVHLGTPHTHMGPPGPSPSRPIQTSHYVAYNTYVSKRAVGIRLKCLLV